MSGRDEDIFAFDSSENITQNYSSSSIECINFTAEEPEQISAPFNYQTARRIEQAKSMLKNHSLIAYESIQTGQPICLIKAKLKAKLCPEWTPEKEIELFDTEGNITNCKDYTIVTPSHTFIEIDDVPHNSSYASSFGAPSTHKTYSPSSFKSPDRLKHFK
jgi:hypothetical protein